MKRAITWWMSAPVDEKAAVVIVVVPWLLASCICVAASN
jgi:hypothetical protein